MQSRSDFWHEAQLTLSIPGKDTTIPKFLHQGFFKLRILLCVAFSAGIWEVAIWVYKHRSLTPAEMGSHPTQPGKILGQQQPKAGNSHVIPVSHLSQGTEITGWEEQSSSLPLTEESPFPLQQHPQFSQQGAVSPSFVSELPPESLISIFYSF